MIRINQDKRSITPERAQAKLSEYRIIVPTSKAAQVLDFLYNLATIEFEQLQKNK